MQLLSSATTPRPDHDLWPMVVRLGDDEMVARYRVVGGLATGDQIAEHMSERVDQPVSLVARWIVTQRVVHIRFNGLLMLPLFQFDWDQMGPSCSVTAVIEALRHWQCDREIAAWFVSSNTALNDEWPVRMLHQDKTAVLNAARAGPKPVQSHSLMEQA